MKHKEEIFRLKALGYSYKRIQEELGCSKGTISYHLGAGQKEKTKERKDIKRSAIRKFIQEYKQSRSCADCKENYPYWMMDFDHLRDKSFGLGRWLEYTTNLEIIKQEIEKCEVVCANCHRTRTHTRSGAPSALNVSQYYE